MCRIKLRTRNSPDTTEVERPEPPDRWKRVSAGDSDIYLPWNAPVEALVIPSQKFVFGQVEGGDERTAAKTMERPGSAQIEAALLAEHSQHMRQGQNLQDKDFPVSSEPATKYPERLYGVSKCRRRRARTKMGAVKVRKAQGRETACLARARSAPPPENASKCCYGVYRPRRQCGQIKTVSIDTSRVLEGQNTYLGQANAMHLMWRYRPY